MSAPFDSEMYVVKRNGEREIVSFDKILKRIKTLGQEVGIQINYTTLVMKVIDQLYDGISTSKIDELTAAQCASLASTHPDYNILAGRIAVSSHQKNTSNSFLEVAMKLYNYTDKHGAPSPLVTKEFVENVVANESAIEAAIDYSRDYLIDYFGFKTLERAYLMSIDRVIVERPQHMWMRVAIAIHGQNMDRVWETYDLMSEKYFTHATPTLFNAGTPHPQLSSCFLLAMENDSIDGIYSTLRDCALISKWAGGIGLHIHNVRAKGSHIRGTNGSSNGIVPMLRVFNNTAKYVDQCVHPETVIWTTRGPKQIQHCVAGETAILNRLGEPEVIQAVLEHVYEGEIIKIKSESATPLIITPEHPVYVLRDASKYTELSLQSALEKRHIQFEWMEAKEINTDDYIVHAIPRYEADDSRVTLETCAIYGTMVDCIFELPSEPGFTFKPRPSQREKLVEYFDSNSIDYKIVGDDPLIIVEKSPSFPFKTTDFFSESGDLRLHPKWLNLSLDKIRVIRDAISKRGPRLQYDIEYLDLRLYSNSGSFLWYKDDVGKIYHYGDFVLRPVIDIQRGFYEGLVYDLQMTKQHNYQLHSGLVHNGGGKRNGSFAIYLEPWHSDIEAFLQMRKNHGDEELKARDLFYALWIPDLFMERVKADGGWTLMCPDECPGLADVYGDEFVKLYTRYENEGKGRQTVKARALWFQMLDAQMETGTPYILYKDACNRKSNQQNLGTIKSSNLCVAPETLILTDKGHVQISDLVGQKTRVWNGTEFSEVDVFQTGEDQELMEVETDDGCKLVCTPYHKFFIQNSYNKKDCKLIEAKDLKSGYKLKKCDYPVIDGKSRMNYAYTHGFFCGDGTYSNNNFEHKRCEWKPLEGHYFCKRHIDFETEFSIGEIKNNENTSLTQCNAMSYVKKPVSYLYGEKKSLLEHMEYRTKTENDTRIVLQLPLDIDEKYYVPMECSLNDKLEWFAGYCDADGTIANNGDNQQLQIASINREFLVNVKRMLQTCGINPKIKHARDEGTSYLPDGKGGYKEFETQTVYRLLITSCDLCKIIDIGFSPKRLRTHSQKPNRNATQFIKISSIKPLDRRDNTFCFTEPKQSAGIFNGILTSQCSEVVQYSDDKESAVCNLASIALPTFVKSIGGDLAQSASASTFDFEKLHLVARTVTYNLNRVIDVNYYPTEKTQRSNVRHRPIGIGIQGLADVFMVLGLPFASEEARELNRQIFETIYHAAVEESCEMARVEGAYETFAGSPASQGRLQFDLWNIDPGQTRYDWATLKSDVMKYGMRNSLLVAPMPTASTSQILGFNECIEPITSNIYSRRTLAGEFILANKYLMNDLIKLDLWNDKIKNNIIANHGSIQQIDSIPQNIKDLYKTVWEIPMRALIDMAADRGAYVCQSQSLNLWLEDPNYNSLTSMHFYSWSKGLKTGIYYLRRRARHQAQQFTIEPERNETGTNNLEEDEICEMCSA